MTQQSNEIDQVVIPLVDEYASISKRDRISGRVTVRNYTEERETLVKELLSQETVEIERVAVGREVDEPPQIRTDGDHMIIPVLEERLVVEKRLFLVEEIHLRRRTEATPIERSVTLRRMHAEIERTPGDRDPSATIESKETTHG